MLQRLLLAIAFGGFTFGLAAAAPAPVKVNIAVLPCAQDAAAKPDLYLSDIDRRFARLQIHPDWHEAGGVWATRVDVPRAHYIVDASSQHCSGASQQWVALPGGERHVLLALNESKILTTDENMYAAAVYGHIPMPEMSVELLPADSVLGDSGRRSGTIDGDTYQFGHVVPGRYYVVMGFGAVRAARMITVPTKPYGATVEVSMEKSTALGLSQAESAGSRFHEYSDPKFGPYSMFELGPSSDDGWIANPLPAVAGYPVWGKQLSSAVVRSVEIARKLVVNDEALPPELRKIEAYEISVAAYGGNGRPLFLRLIPRDEDLWARSVTLMGSPCAESRTGIAIHGMGMSIDLAHDSATVITICP